MIVDFLQLHDLPLAKVQAHPVKDGGAFVLQLTKLQFMLIQCGLLVWYSIALYDYPVFWYCSKYWNNEYFSQYGTLSTVITMAHRVLLYALWHVEYCIPYGIESTVVSPMAQRVLYPYGT